MWDIQHCIDFILGAMIPNKVAYWMSPIEHAKLQKQVDELILKCLVNESKSSCVVLAFLVSKKDVS
jgi:hypothetical protein